LHQVKDRSQVYIEHIVPFVQRRILDIPVSDYPGGVHQNVDLSKFLDGVSDQSIYLRNVGDISHV